MIIFGTRTFRFKKGATKELIACENCGLHLQWKLVHIWSWFTLFFIPVFPYRVKKVLICPNCEYGIKVNSKNKDEVLNSINSGKGGDVRQAADDSFESQNKAIAQEHERVKDFAMPLQNDSFVQSGKSEGIVSSSLYKQISKYQGCISAGNFHTVGLKSNGTIVADGDKKQCNIFGWRYIIMVAAGYERTIGLKADGTVVVAGGAKRSTLGDINTWSDIISISVKEYTTVGLKADGTVVAVGCNYDGECNTKDWRDIVAVSTGGAHTVGLKADGTVVAVGKNNKGQCNTEKWADIVAVSAGGKHTAGLKADGTVVIAGEFLNIMTEKNPDFASWRSIVAISSDNDHIVGLKADGTVEFASTMPSMFGLKNVSEWRGIVAVSVGARHIVGLKADGTVVAAGVEADGCNTGSWRDIGPVSKENLLQEKLKRDNDPQIQAEEQEEQVRYWAEQGLCRYCGGKLSLVGSKCKSCGKAN